MAFVNPNTNLTIPNVGDSGPGYAEEISTDVNALCNITHTGAANNDGPQLTQAALNFTGDLPLNSYNLINVRSLRCVNETSVLSGVNDVNCFYVVNGEAYFNEASGNPVQLTSGGSIITPSQVAFTTTSVSNTNLTILAASTYNLVNVSTTSLPVTITLPVAAGLVRGRFYYFVDTGGNAASNNITIQVAGGSGNTISAEGVSGTSVVLNGNGEAVLIYTDGVNSFYALFFNQTVFYGTTITYINSTLDIASGSTLSSVNGSTVTLNSATITTNGTLTVAGGAAVNSTMSGNVAGAFTSVATGAMTSSIAAGITSGVVGGIELTGGSTDWPTFSANRTRNLCSVLVPTCATFGTNWLTDVANSGSIFTAVVSDSGGNTNYQAFNLLPLHNGATLNTVTIMFAVTANHMFSFPVQYYPNLQVKRVALNSGGAIDTEVFLSATTRQYLPSPASSAAYYNGGNQQTLTYTCSVNNVIDTSQYLYYVLLQDENGTSSIVGNKYLAMICNYTNIANMQFP